MNSAKELRKRKIENIKDKVLSEGLEYLVGEFISIDELSKALRELDKYERGMRGNDHVWYDNVISTRTKTVSALNVVDIEDGDKIYDIIVISEEITGDMVEDVQFHGYRVPSIETLEVQVSAGVMEEQYDIPKKHFDEFIEFLQSGLHSWLDDMDFFHHHAEAFKDEKLQKDNKKLGVENNE